MNESLTLTTDDFGGVPIVRIQGPLTFGNNLAALHSLAATLRDDGHHRIVVDLSRVSAIDSSGLAALLDVRAIIGTALGQIVLFQPTRRVDAALKLIRVDSLFVVARDRPELMARLQAPVDGANLTAN